MDGDDSIAIVGIGCKFPGANNIEEYWTLLKNGECHVKDIPKERFNVDAIYDADPSSIGKSYVRKAGLLEKHLEWDNHVFGIGEKEAMYMDPQQRYVLECVHMAMEDGGITKQNVNGTATGVYIGAMNCDYNQAKFAEHTLVSNYSVTGDAASITSARVSYLYNLLGPSMMIDTACSSSLVAIHQAVQAMNSGDIEMAICGGVNSILYPDMFIALSRARMASPTGLSQAFSANADGYARGEGCGIVILEKLGNAIKNRRRIWGTIQTGCNQDGQTVRPITSPSGSQQTNLLKHVYNKYNVDPSLIQYIEAHGTGTPVGDPVEVNSLGEFFLSFPSVSDNERWIGSVKTNIGHLESAAGVAALIKVLLMMKHETIVQSLHSESLNPKIEFDQYHFQVPRKCLPWLSSATQSRMACVNCFGFGGTNSHAIIKQYHSKPERCPSDDDKKQIHVVALSAETKRSILKSISNLLSNLQSHSLKIGDLSYTSTVRRDHFRLRVAFAATSSEDLKALLNERLKDLEKKDIKVLKKKNLMFVFCGVGTTWKGMCSTLIQHPVFLRTLQDIDKHLLGFVGWSIVEKLTNQDDMVDPMVCHIAIFSCQIGLAALWEHFGIVPDAIVGQSVGEVAAAYVAGVLTLEESVKVIYYRSLFLSQATGGTMMVIRNYDVEQVRNICSSLPPDTRANVAVHSSPTSCTISGDQFALNEIRSKIENKGNYQAPKPVFTNLTVKCAYHSHHVLEAADKLAEALKGLDPKPAKIQVYSTAIGDLVRGAYFGKANYWRLNIIKEVKMSQTLDKMVVERSENIFLEVGPKPILRAHLDALFPHDQQQIKCFPSMTSSNETGTLMSTVARLYELGFNLMWENITQQHYNLIDVPKYQFDCSEFFTESTFTRLVASGEKPLSESRNLLVERETGPQNKLKMVINPQSTPFIYNHLIDDLVVVPGAVYAEVGFELGRILLGIQFHDLDISYKIESMIPVTNRETLKFDIITEWENTVGNGIVFIVEYNSTVCAKGIINQRHANISIDQFPISEMSNTCLKSITGGELYSSLEEFGYTIEQPVQMIKTCKFNDFESFSLLDLSEDIYNKTDQSGLHPAVFDACFHSLVPTVLTYFQNDKSTKLYPVHVGSVMVRTQLPNRMFCYSRVVQYEENRILANIMLMREDGYVIAEIRDVEQRVMDGKVQLSKLIYDLQWNVTDIPADSLEYLEKKAILVFSYQSKDVLGMKDVFPNASYVHLDLRKSDDSCISETVSKALKSSSEPLIVFVPGYNSLSGTFDVGAVQSSCHVFLDVMRIISDRRIPIIVMTQKTQYINGYTTGELNLAGSELWGFVRSSRLEISSPIYLVDLQCRLSEVQKQLQLLSCCCIRETMHFPFDFALFPAQLLQLSFEHIEYVGLKSSYRHGKCNSSDTLELRSKYPDALRDSFFVRIEQRHLQKKQLLINVNSVYNLHIRENENDDRQVIWPEYNESGYPVIATEIHGEISNRMAIKTEEEVIACYPVKVCSTVSVPEVCVCYLSRLHYFRPGLITTSVLAWSLMRHVKSKSSVCIISENNDDLLTSLLSRILGSQKQCRTTIVLHNAQQICDVNDSNVIILLTRKSRNMLSKLNTEKRRHLMGFSDVISEKFKESLLFQNVKHSIQVVSKADCFHRNELPRFFPALRKWLEKHAMCLKIPLERNEKCYLEKNIFVFPNKTTSEQIDINIPARDIFSKNGTYLVIGGLTGLGWEVTKWLARMGAGSIISLSRSEPSEESLYKMRTVELIHQTSLSTVQCDICNFESLSKAFDKMICSPKYLPIKGIFQGAGILRDTYLNGMTRQKITEVLRPKVNGTWNLHILSLKFQLDFFVLQSSIASVFGNPGQTNYSAANAFLDTFAHYRRSIGLPCQSLNWGALDVGMVGTRSTVKQQLENMGHTALSVQQISGCLLDAVIQDKAQRVYAQIDWAKTGIIYKTRREVELEKNPKANKKTSDSSIAKAFSPISEDQAPEEEAISKFLKVVITAAAKVLSIDELDVETTQTLTQQGIESQQATEFIQRIYDITGRKLSIAYVLAPDFTVQSIAKTLASQNPVSETPTQESENKTALQPSPQRLKHAITYMEKNVLDVMRIPGKLPFFKIDVKTRNRRLTTSSLNEALRHMMIQYPELRSKFQLSSPIHQFGVEKMTVDPEDIESDCQVFEIDNSERQSELSSICRIDTTQSFRVYFHTNAQEQIIRMLFRHVSFDLPSAITFAHCLLDFSTEFTQRKKQSELVLKPEVNIQAKIQEEIELGNNDLEKYWRSEFSKLNRMPAGDLKSQRLPNSMKTKCKQLNKAFVLKARNNSLDITSLLCSVYTIILCRSYKMATCPVALICDTRQHFTMLAGRFAMGSKVVPLLATVSTTDLFHTSVWNVMAKVQKVRQMPLYSLDKLKQIEGFDMSHFRHCFTNIRIPVNPNDKTTKFEIQEYDHIFDGYIDEMETGLLVEEDDRLQTVKLYFTYNSAKINENFVEALLSDIVSFSKNFLCEEDQPFADIEMKSRAFDDVLQFSTDTEIPLDPMFLVTSDGKEEPVSLKVDLDRSVFTWSDKQSSTDMPFSNIEDIHVKNTDASEFVLRANSTEYMFRSNDRSYVQAIMKTSRDHIYQKQNEYRENLNNVLESTQL